MSGAKKSTWIGATAFGALVILLAAWFLGVSPALASASDLHGQADQTRQQNDLLQLQVNSLAAEFKKLPDYKAKLAAIQTQMPSDPKLADFLRQLDQTAVAHQVAILSVTPGTPTAVSIAATPAAAAAPAAGTAPAPDPSPSPSVAAPGPAPAAATGAEGAVASTPPGFESVNFSLQVQGTYANTLAFLYDLQNTVPRIFLVGGLQGQSLSQTPATGGHPASQVGDQLLTIAGLTYVLPDALATPAPAPTAPPALPAPNGRNPLVPIVKQ